MKLIVTVLPGVYAQGMAFVGDTTYQDVVDYLDGIMDDNDPFFVPQEMERAYNALSVTKRRILKQEIDRAAGVICETSMTGRVLTVCKTEAEYAQHFHRIESMIRGGGQA